MYRLSPREKQKYETIKDGWNKIRTNAKVSQSVEIEKANMRLHSKLKTINDRKDTQGSLSLNGGKEKFNAGYPAAVYKKHQLERIDVENLRLLKALATTKPEVKQM